MLDQHFSTPETDSSAERAAKAEPALRRKERGVTLLGIGLAVLLATATFFSGLHFGSETRQEANLFSFFRTTQQPSAEVNLDEFWNVWRILEEKFAASTTTEPVTAESRVHGAIEGMVRSYGDPYTTFMPPADAALFGEEISGNFGGVGMEVGIRDDLVTVIAPLPGTPAERAGILAGDVIVRINDTSTERMSTDEAVRLIRGESGTEVKLTMYRKGEDGFKEFAIVREKISIPTSKIETVNDTFIISLYSFNALSEMEMQTALRQFVESGKRKLILDLRGNPGGYLQSAVSIASYFLPVGKVVVRESFGDGKTEEVYRSSGKTLGRAAPEAMVVLIDGGSASASEILAGALKEHGVASLIGETTFGKGSVQELVNLKSGASLKVTTAQWLTPDGTSISEGGLKPDIEVKRTVEDRTEGRDPQREAALEFLSKSSQ